MLFVVSVSILRDKHLNGFETNNFLESYTHEEGMNHNKIHTLRSMRNEH
jgi:hypothetical protein